MKNYPIFDDLKYWKTWTTFLKELNIKVSSLYYHSNIFLTDYLEYKEENFLDLREKTLYYNGILQDEPSLIFDVGSLPYHGFYETLRNCFIPTSKETYWYSEEDGIRTYYQPIAAGTYIVQKNRAEGSVDFFSPGWLNKLFGLGYTPSSGHLALQSEEPLQLYTDGNSSGKTIASPERYNEEHILIQPIGFLSFFNIQSKGKGTLLARFVDKGEEIYKNTVDFTILTENARLIAKQNLLHYQLNSKGINILSKDPYTLEPNIATLNGQLYTDIENPPMCFHFRSRDDVDFNYGEEVISDFKWRVKVQQFAKTATIVYSIENQDLDNTIVDQLSADLI